MIYAEMAPAAVGRICFAPSPAHEVVSWLELVRRKQRHPVFGDPGPAARRALADDDVRLVAQLLPVRGQLYTPDLLTPQPLASGGLDAQLAMTECAAEADVISQLRQRFAGESMPNVVRDHLVRGTIQRCVAAGIHKFWRACLAEEWSTVQRGLASDVRHRGEQIAAVGIFRAVTALDSRLAWSGPMLSVAVSSNATARFVDDRVVFCPTMLGWPKLSAQLTNGADAFVVYPAEGIGVTRQAPPRRAHPLGERRRQLLTALARPATTSQLADDMNAAPSTISHHLAQLLGAGFVEKHRSGKAVIYSLTALGRHVDSVGRPD